MVFINLIQKYRISINIKSKILVKTYSKVVANKYLKIYQLITMTQLFKYLLLLFLYILNIINNIYYLPTFMYYSL